MEGERVSKF